MEQEVESIATAEPTAEPLQDYTEVLNGIYEQMQMQTEILAGQDVVMNRYEQYQQYTSGFLLFMVIVALCYFTYKFFKIFF